MTMSDGVRRLTRRREGKIIGGVAAGLGDYFAVDPIWFRLGFVLTTLLGGAGLIAYVVLLVILPDDTTGEPTLAERGAERVARSLRGTPAWIGIALIILGGLLIVTQLANWSAGIFWGITLIVLGVALFRRQEDRRSDEAAPIPSVAVDAPPVPGDVPSPGAGVTPRPMDAPPAPDTAAREARWARARRARRERSGLGWLTIGATLVVLGAASLLDAGNAIHVTLVQYLALALTVLGLGIGVGTFYGRARWLTIPALALIPFVLTASLIGVPFKGGTGDRLYRPATVAAIRPTYRLAAGRMVIDLRGVTFGPAPTTIRATLVAGRILVLVPRTATVEIRGRVGAGNVTVLERSDDGVKVDVHRTLTGVGKAPPIIRLDLETSLGVVEVRS